LAILGLFGSAKAFAREPYLLQARTI
jgi:hypothetical protein